MNNDIVLKGILEFDKETGLKCHTRAEILEDLKTLTRLAFGTDFVIEQGNEWFSFLDALAGSLTNISGSAQDLYDSLSFLGASGTQLDNIVAFCGITRKTKQNSTVLIKATIEGEGINTLSRPYIIKKNSLILKDENGGLWQNTEDLVIKEFGADGETPNYFGTAEFQATETNADPTGIIVTANSKFTVYGGSISSYITLTNEIQSVLGRPEETDAQLRARYKQEIFNKSSGTLEGLKARLQALDIVDYVCILENTTGDIITDTTKPNYNVDAHSIWVIIDTVDENGNHIGSTWDGTGEYSKDANDIEIANTILQHKSIGCGLSYGSSAAYDSEEGTGKIPVKLTIDNNEYAIKFSRASKVDVTVNIQLNGNLVAEQKEIISANVKTNIMNYINNLGINNDVLYSGLVSSIFAVHTENNYTDYIFDVTSLTCSGGDIISGSRIPISVSQFPMVTEDKIIITWGS